MYDVFYHVKQFLPIINEITERSEFYRVMCKERSKKYTFSNNKKTVAKLSENVYNTYWVVRIHDGYKYGQLER